MLAARHGKTDATHALLVHGASGSRTNLAGQMALDIAEECKQCLVYLCVVAVVVDIVFSWLHSSASKSAENVRIAALAPFVASGVSQAVQKRRSKLGAADDASSLERSQELWPAMASPKRHCEENGVLSRGVVSKRQLIENDD